VQLSVTGISEGFAVAHKWASNLQIADNNTIAPHSCIKLVA
jgi:hypothetical protein